MYATVILYCKLKFILIKYANISYLNIERVLYIVVLRK